MAERKERASQSSRLLTESVFHIGQKTELFKDIDPMRLADMLKGKYEKTHGGTSEGKIRFGWSSVIIHYDREPDRVMGSKLSRELDCCVENPLWRDSDNQPIRPSIKNSAVFLQNGKAFIVLPNKNEFNEIGYIEFSSENQDISMHTVSIDPNLDVAVRYGSLGMEVIKAAKMARKQDHYDSFYGYQEEKANPTEGE